VSILTVTFIAVLFPGQETNMFTLVLVHNGFFTGLRGTVEYIDATAYSFDNCSSDTWSLFWVDEMLRTVGLSREGKLRVYWLSRQGCKQWTCSIGESSCHQANDQC
jgi:hypothetical protein